MTAELNDAILGFAKLTLADKVEAIANALVTVEARLERAERRLGHFGERPSDYTEAIGLEVLGLDPRELSVGEAVFRTGLPTATLFERAGIALSASEAKCLDKIEALVIAPAAPDNSFLALIDGHEVIGARLPGMTSPWAIRNFRHFAKLLQAGGAFEHVFVGEFSIISAHAEDKSITDQSFSLYSVFTRPFRHKGQDALVYAAGVQFPS